MLVGVKLLHIDAKMPTYADYGASGFDFYSIEEGVIEPKSSAVVRTGIAFDIPRDHEIQVRGRSGLAFNEDIIAHFGTVDESYKGEVKVKLFNLGDKPRVIRVGDRIAQGVLAPVKRAYIYETDSLKESTRGEGGFGSTGR